MEQIYRNEIYLARLEKNGSIQGGIRPVLIIQNDVGNEYSPTTIIAPITSRIKHHLPTHIEIEDNKIGIKKQSIILCEQIQTINKIQLIEKIGKINNKILLHNINKAIKISLSLED